MPTPVLMPKLGESVVEGTVARWLKQPGDAVEKLEPLLEITTDKIDTEIPSPDGGFLLAIHVPEGQTVRAGTVLATIGAAGETPEQSVPKETAQAAASASRPAPAAEGGQVRLPEERPSGRAFVSPVVRKIAREFGVDLEQVEGTGLAGRVTRQDILAHVEKIAAAPVAAPAAEAQVPSTDELLRPLSAMRRAIAQHMVQSVQTSPHVTTVFEVDMTAVVRHREGRKADYAGRGIKLSFTPYFVAATAAALREFPLANSRFGENGIIENRRVHIGVAVALTDGLLVPVVRDAEELTLAGLARAIEDLAARARAGKLAPDDLSGGTFTITNHGVSGSLIGTPIIHQPQSGILGIGAVVKRPVVRSVSASLLPDADDAIVIRPMAYLSYSFDHRLLDGAAADAFVAAVKRRLEEWPGQA